MSKKLPEISFAVLCLLPLAFLIARAIQIQREVGFEAGIRLWVPSKNIALGIYTVFLIGGYLLLGKKRFAHLIHTHTVLWCLFITSLVLSNFVYGVIAGIAFQ
jgi:hypothetical protein